jgi:hypothetical protein
MSLSIVPKPDNTKSESMQSLTFFAKGSLTICTSNKEQIRRKRSEGLVVRKDSERGKIAKVRGVDKDRLGPHHVTLQRFLAVTTCRERQQRAGI